MSSSLTITNNINTPTTSNSNTTPTRRTASLEAKTQQQLSQCILTVLSSYHIFKCISDYTNVFEYCNTCQLLFKYKKYVNYKLNKFYSLMYYDDETFRARILNKIDNPRKQLYINLENHYFISDVSVLGNVCNLDLHGCKKITNVSPLSRIRTLNLSYCINIINISPLINVHNLNLSFCKNIINYSILGKGTIHTLNLSYTNVLDEDIKSLGTLNTLILSGCSNITDVSPLINVRILDLSFCKNIIDFTVLRNGSIHTLDLSYCYVTEEIIRLLKNTLHIAL